MMKQLKKLLLRVPVVNAYIVEHDNLIRERDTFTRFVPPGHFYSPIPSIVEVMKDRERIWSAPPSSLPGIDLNDAGQLALLDEFDGYYRELPFTDEKSGALRYYFVNGAYSYSDAIFLYCMIRHARPAAVIEAGSGYSSCVILDTNELFFDNAIKCSFIEPYPEVLKSLVKPSDMGAITIHESRLQDVPMEVFTELRENDILFIDSTHVSKIHSDVNYIFHEVLPALRAGVYIHFHDIFYPFEYSKEWIEEGRAWNEQYLLRAFLEFNSHFTIVLFNTFLETMYEKELRERFPLAFKNPGGSIWLRKIR